MNIQTTKNTRHRSPAPKFLLLAAAAVLFFQSVASYGQQARDDQKANETVQRVGMYLNPSLYNQLEVHADETGDFVQIDDMRFRVDELRAFGYVGRFWSHGQLVYELAPEVVRNRRKRSAFADACRLLEQHSGVKCIERTQQTIPVNNYVYVQSDTSNFSYVGSVGGKQLMGIYNWTSGVITHEILHALGWEHEHCRTDRDKFVNINWSNIKPSKRHNFCKVPNGDTRFPYDFDSIMHYGPYDFSINEGRGLKTIEPLPDYAHREPSMGQRCRLSDTDLHQLTWRYGARGTQWCGDRKKPTVGRCKEWDWICYGHRWVCWTECERDDFGNCL